MFNRYQHPSRQRSDPATQYETRTDVKMLPKHAAPYLTPPGESFVGRCPEGFEKATPLRIKPGDVVMGYASNGNVLADQWQHFHGQKPFGFSQFQGCPVNIPKTFLGVAVGESVASGASDANVTIAISGIRSIILRSGSGCKAGDKLYAIAPSVERSKRTSGVEVDGRDLYPEITALSTFSIAEIFKKEDEQLVAGALEDVDTLEKIIERSAEEIENHKQLHEGKKGTPVKEVESGLVAAAVGTVKKDNLCKKLCRDLHSLYVRAQAKMNEHIAHEFAWRKIHADASVDDLGLGIGATTVLRNQVSVAFNRYLSMLVVIHKQTENLCFIGTALEACAPEGKVRLRIGQ